MMASANQYKYNRSSPDTLTRHNLCSCPKGFETITLKSIHSFKIGSAKSMFAFIFISLLFQWFSLFKYSVCVCAYLLCSNCIYNLCAHASCNFLYGNAIQCDIKVQGLEKWGCIGWTNFSPWSRICDITKVWLLSLHITAWPEIGIWLRKLLNYRSQLFKSHIF